MNSKTRGGDGTEDQKEDNKEEDEPIPRLVERAYQRMRSSNHPPRWTALEKSVSLSNVFDTEIYFKCEHL